MRAISARALLLALLTCVEVQRSSECFFHFSPRLSNLQKLSMASVLITRRVLPYSRRLLISPRDLMKRNRPLAPRLSPSTSRRLSSQFTILSSLTKRLRLTSIPTCFTGFLRTSVGVSPGLYGREPHQVGGLSDEASLKDQSSVPFCSTSLYATALSVSLPTRTTSRSASRLRSWRRSREGCKATSMPSKPGLLEKNLSSLRRNLQSRSSLPTRPVNQKPTLTSPSPALRFL